MAQITPFVKRMRTQGGTFYSFTSATEDIGLNINERNNVVKMSHFAMLDIPRISPPSTIEENTFNVLAIDGALDIFSQSGNIKDGRVLIAESFQNYALNLESNLLSQDDYNPVLSKTVSERVFWKWLKETGSIRWVKDVSHSGYFIEEIDTDASAAYNSVVKYVGQISAGSIRTDTHGSYNETYILVPTSHGQSRVYFKQDYDDNYYPNMEIGPGGENILGRDGYTQPHPDGLEYKAYYDVTDSSTSADDWAMSVDTGDGSGPQQGWWYTAQGKSFSDDLYYVTDASTVLEDSSINYILRYDNGGDTFEFYRSNVDGVGIELNLDNLRNITGDSTLTFDKMAMEESVDDEFQFNAILVYYSVYNKTLDKILSTNLLGILFLDAPTGNTAGFPDFAINIPTITKLQSTGSGFGTSYSFKINIKSDNMIDDTGAVIYDESTSSQTALSNWTDVFTSLEKTLSILNSNTKSIQYITDQYSTLSSTQTQQGNTISDIQYQVNDLIGDITGTNNTIAMFKDGDDILVESQIFMNDEGNVGIFNNDPSYGFQVDTPISKFKDIIIQNAIRDASGNVLLGYGSPLTLGSSTNYRELAFYIGSATPAMFFDTSGNVILDSSSFTISGNVNLSNADITFDKYIREASLGPDLMWVNGLLEVDYSPSEYFRWGNETSDYLIWDNSTQTLTIKANLTASDGSVYADHLRLNDIEDSEKLTEAEKIYIRERWERIEREYAINQQVADDIGVSLVYYDVAFIDLSSYINTFLDLYDSSTTILTGIGGREYFNDRFNTYYDKLTELGNDFYYKFESDVSSAFSELDDLADDGKLTESEKITVRATWDAIQQEYVSMTAIAQSLSVVTTNYVGSFIDLSTYLNGLNPSLDSSTTTILDLGGRANFNSKFNTYYDERVKLDNSLDYKIDADASTALKDLSDIAADDKLTIDEKIKVRAIWEDIQSDYPLDITAASNIGISYTDYQLAFYDLSTYIDGNLNLYADVTTNIFRDIFDTTFRNYYTERTILFNTTLDTIDGAVKIIEGDLSDFSDDGRLTTLEKISIRTEWGDIIDEYPAILASADAINVNTTYTTQYTDSFYDLSTYIDGSLNLYADVTTTIDRTDYDTTFRYYYSSRTELLNRVSLKINDDASTALKDLFNMSADGVLTNSEKIDIRKEWLEINEEYPLFVESAENISTGADTFAYIQSVIDLSTYLFTTMSPNLNSTADSTINRTTFNNLFSSYYVERRNLQDDVVGLVQNEAILAQGWANDASLQAAQAVNQLDAMAADDVLTPQEKLDLRAEVDDINSEYPLYVDAATTVSVSSTAYTTAYNSLTTYIGTLNLNGDVNTTIVRSTFNTKFGDYYEAKVTLVKNIQEATDGKAVTATQQAAIANAVLNDMADDDKLTPPEKSTLRTGWAAIEDEYPEYIAKANGYSVSTTRYTTEFSDLSTYIKPKIFGAEATTTTPINSSTFTNTYNDYFRARNDLDTSILTTATDISTSIDVNWGDIPDKPTLFDTPSGSGLFLDETHLGYYSGGVWQTYMDNSGNFSLGDAPANNGLFWSQSDAALLINGEMIITDGSIGGFRVNTDRLSFYDGGTQTLTLKNTVGSSSEPGRGLNLINTNTTNGTISKVGVGQLYNKDSVTLGSNYGFEVLQRISSTYKHLVRIAENEAIIGGWNLSNRSLYSGTEYTNNGYSTDGMTLDSGGAIHTPNFYVNTTGEVGFRGQIVYEYAISNTTIGSALGSTLLTNNQISYVELDQVTMGSNIRSSGVTVRFKINFDYYIPVGDASVAQLQWRLERQLASSVDWVLQDSGSQESSTEGVEYNQYGDCFVHPGDKIRLLGRIQGIGLPSNHYIQVKTWYLCGGHIQPANEVGVV